MKFKLLALTLLMVPITTFAQIKVDSTSGSYSVSETVSVPAKTKIKLFYSAQEWGAGRYENYKSSIEYENKDSGKIIIKPTESIPGGDAMLLYTLTIECKDKKYRATISDIKINQYNRILNRWNEWPFDFFIGSLNENEIKLNSELEDHERKDLKTKVMHEKHIKNTSKMMMDVVLLTLKPKMKGSSDF